MKGKAQGFESRQVMKRDNYEIFYYKESKPAVEVHHHDFYEVYYLLDGKISYWVDGEIYNLKRGDMLLINPMILHRPLLQESAVYERIVLWIEKSFLENLSKNSPLNKCFYKKLNIIHPNAATRAELIDKLSTIIKESNSTEYASNIYADGALMQFLAELNRIAVKRAESTKKVTSKKLISNVLDYINNNYNKEITLENLANKFYISKYHLSHEFSHFVGTGVYRYIMLKRLLEAKRLLLNGSTAKETCLLCGFKDYANFYRAFKSEYGISPKEFKDSLS